MRLNGPPGGVIFPPVQRFLRLNGTGTHQIIADYSETSALFYIGPPAGSIWRLFALAIMINGDAALRNDAYGTIAGGLDNGVLIRIHRTNPSDGGAARYYDVLDGVSLVCNACFGSHFHDYDAKDFGVGPNTISAEWRGGVVVLDGDEGDRIEITAQDDFSSLNAHTFKIMGDQIVGPIAWDG